MKLKHGYEEENKKRHDEIWPDLSTLLHETGISDYNIFLDPETLILFAVMKINKDYGRISLENHPLMKRWRVFMADIMETNPDNSPVVKPLKQVFYLP